MTGLIVVRTEEPCPACGAPLDMPGDGQALIRAVCGLCGYAEFWTGQDENGGRQ